MVAMSNEGNTWTCVRPAKEERAQVPHPVEESWVNALNVPRWAAGTVVSLTLKSRTWKLVERDVLGRVKGWLPLGVPPRGFSAALERSTMWLRRLLRDKLTSRGR